MGGQFESTVCVIKRLLCVTALLYACIRQETTGYTHADEEPLRTTLLTGHNNDVRPETPIDVQVTLTLMSLNYLDIGAQEMCVNIVIVTTWTDSRLVWTPASHNGIETLVLRYGTVWQPTLVIENTIDDAGLYGDDEAAPVRVSSNGFSTWISPAYARVSCKMTVTYFPFDQQTCKISVYAWANDITEVNLTNTLQPWYLSEYSENGEWDVVDTGVKEHLASDGLDTFKILYFSLTFKRKWVFPFLSLLVPGVLNAMLMCAVFSVPFEGTDKLAYSLTVLLSYYVLFTYVSDILPATSTHIALLQVYLTFVMIVGTLSTLVSVWIVFIYNYSEDNPVPGWVLRFYNVSTIILCQKNSCKNLSNLCRTCGSRRSNRTEAAQTRQNRNETTNDSSLNESSSSLNQNRVQTTSMTLSHRANVAGKQPQWKAEEVEQQTGTTTFKSGTNSDDAELSSVGYASEISEDNNHNVRKVAKLSADNATSDVSRLSRDIDAISKKLASSRKNNFCSCSKTGNAFVMFNQESHVNGKCEKCSQFVSVEDEADAVLEDEDDDKEKELTWRMVAARMDQVFFRVTGGVISLFTLILLILLLAHY